MNKRFYFIAFLAIVFIFPTVAQERLTGFSEIKLYIDPGHSGTGNVGWGGYSEAHKNLEVSLAMVEYLLAYTDFQAANIQFSRRTHTESEITFSAKANAAAAMGAHLYFSPHSDASGDINAASNLFLYGGIRPNGPRTTPEEKHPRGGKRAGEILNADLTSTMRLIRSNGAVTSVGTRGNINDLNFYTWVAGIEDRVTPYLGVHSNTLNRTASILTEAGFHTNPAQNMQFVNVEHKRMQAYSYYQSLVRYFSEKYMGGMKQPVQVGIATGFVFDNETSRPINGAVITVTEAGKDPKVYTTDTWDSLPVKYSFNRETFGNGFWWIEGFTPGATVDVKVEAQGYVAQEVKLTIPLNVGSVTQEGLAVRDFRLVNNMPARVSNVSVRRDMKGNVIPRYPLDITFSREMDRASVEAAISISPEANVTYSWLNDFTLRANITFVAFETTYTITIDGSIAKNKETGQFLDGTGDGTPGGNYTFTFKSSDLDEDAPVVVAWDPRGMQEEDLRPIVRIEFDEPLNEASLVGKLIVKDSKGVELEGRQLYHTTANFKSAMHFVFDGDLTPQEVYTVTLLAGVEDLYGNAIKEDFSFQFVARPREIIRSQMLCNATGVGAWWDPSQSGSTNGINTTVSIRQSSTDIIYSSNNTSIRLNYLWTGAGTIRLHRPGNAEFAMSPDNTVQVYFFGDGSNTTFRPCVRAGAASGGTGTAIWCSTPITVDWVGWRVVRWNPVTDPGQEMFTAVGATAKPTEGTMVGVKDFVFQAAPNRYDMPSYFLFDELMVVQLGDELGEAVKHAVTHSTVCEGANGTLVAQAGGAAVSSGSEVRAGMHVTFTANPNPGFEVKEWKVDGEALDHTELTHTITSLSAATAVTVEFKTATGIDILPFANLLVYPNPFTHEITIKGVQNSTLQVVDLLGKVVFTHQISNETETVQLNNLASGIYFLRIEKEGNTAVQQVIKR